MSSASAPRRRSGGRKLRAPRAKKKRKLYSLLTGERIMVAADDPRLDDDENYSTRKPSKKKLRERQVGEALPEFLSPGMKTVVAGAVAPQVLKSVQRTTPRIAKAVVNVAKKVGGTVLPVARTGALAAEGVTLGAPGVVALLAAAGLGSYFGTRWIIDHFPTRQRRLNAAADAYRQSRRTLAASLGRELTAAEQKELAAHYKQVVREINESLF